MQKENITHESFGQVRFTRTTGGSTKFYGSELPQDNYITLEIHKSELQRDIIQDRYYDIGQLIKVRLSSSQFSELITTMNQGIGVPCTLERIMGKKIDEFDRQESRKEFINRSFKEKMKSFSNRISERQLEAKEIIKKKTLSKNDINELSKYIDWMSQEVSQNIPFYAECFQETMDNIVFEAKLEVENAIQHKINVLGLNALHQEQNLLKS